MTPHNFPQNWQITTIEKSCIIKDNLRIPVSAEERKKRNAIANKLYPYYGATGKAGEIDDYIFDEENVLLGEDGAPFLERKKDKAYLVCGKYWVNNHAHILQGKPNILDNKFLCYQLNIIDYSTYISGTTRLKLNQTQMKKIQIKLPPPEIQREIVEILESKLEKIKEAKALLETSLQECETYRLSLLENAFIGNLTPHSQDWQWVTLKSIGKIITGSTPSKANQEFYGDDYPLFKPTDLEAGYYTQEAKDNVSLLGFQQGREIPAKSTLVTCIGATIGKTGFTRTKGICNQQINAIIPDTKQVIEEFVYFYCISPHLQSQIASSYHSTTLPILKKSLFEQLLIPLPSLEIQREIVEILESKLEKIKEAKALLETSLQECETYRLSLLESAFAGELV